ncbi:23358_t:CDS:2 [Gigaspora margarita]|uniref:23358_t:CDS:1 n=1 Tax=Gigaspora margarita TaxID=4874 RepID=A0ABN7USR3_GIGMA|nr:23358_t:CDS:2 [Gigaspora margarita]
MREEQVSVVGKMQTIEALSYWKYKICSSPVVIDWLENGVPLYPRGVLVLAAKPVPWQYSLLEDQKQWVRKELDWLLRFQVIEGLGSQLEILHSNNIHKGLFRGSRAMKKSELAVFGYKNKLIKNLLTRVQKLRRKSVSESWNHHLDKVWVYIKALPSEINTLVSFIVWLDLTHSFSTCADVLATISREHLEHNLPDPSKDYRIKRTDQLAHTILIFCNTEKPTESNVRKIL